MAISSSNNNGEMTFSYMWEKHFVQSEIIWENESVRLQCIHAVVGTFLIFNDRISFHKFTPVFLQIRSKPQTMAERSNRFMTLNIPIKMYIQEQQDKKVSLLGFSEFLNPRERQEKF